MAKKSRRTRRKQTTKTHHSSSPAVVQPSATHAAPAPSARSEAPASPPSRRQVDFRTEYHYVVNDLRTMAIIAVGMLVVLLALSFVIR